MKTYKKLALVVTFFATSETMPMELPTPMPLQKSNDWEEDDLNLENQEPEAEKIRENLNLALELASILTPKSDKENLFFNKQKLSITKKNAAALKIQSRYKQHRAKQTVAKLKNEQLQKKQLQNEEPEDIAQDLASLTRTKSSGDSDDVDKAIAKIEANQHKTNIDFLTNHLIFNEANKQFELNASKKELNDKLNILRDDEIIPIPLSSDSMQKTMVSVKDLRRSLQDENVLFEDENSKAQARSYLEKTLFFKEPNTIMFHHPFTLRDFEDHLNKLGKDDRVDISNQDNNKEGQFSVKEIRTAYNTEKERQEAEIRRRVNLVYK